MSAGCAAGLGWAGQPDGLRAASAAELTRIGSHGDSGLHGPAATHPCAPSLLFQQKSHTLLLGANLQLKAWLAMHSRVFGTCRFHFSHVRRSQQRVGGSGTEAIAVAWHRA